MVKNGRLRKERERKSVKERERKQKRDLKKIRTR